MKLWEAIRRHKIRTFLIVLFFIMSLGRYEYKMPRRNFADFYVYYYTAQKLQARADIYDDNAYRSEGVANFKYPPMSALIFYPLSFLSKHAAAVAWFTINYILILLFFRYSAFLIFDKEFDNRKRNWVYFLSCLFTLRFFLLNFDEGQVSIIMMALSAVSIYLLSKGREFSSALTLTFTCFIKYMTSLFIPYFLFKKKWKFIFFCFLGALIFLVLPGVILGWDYNVYLQKTFLPYVFKTSTDVGSMQDYQNMSLIAMLLRHFSKASYFNINIANMDFQQAKTAFFIFAAFLYLLILLKPAKLLKNARLTECLNYGMIFLNIALFNPNAWKHAFIFMLFAYLVCLYYLFKSKHKDPLVWFLLILSVVLTTWPDKLFIPDMDHSTGVYSFITFGALVLYCALCKIKFSPNIKGGLING